jgi:hypothetical protein
MDEAPAVNFPFEVIDRNLEVRTQYYKVASFEPVEVSGRCSEQCIEVRYVSTSVRTEPLFRPPLLAMSTLFDNNEGL